MNALTQLPFDDDDLFMNPDRRLPCVILADRSGSMSGAKLDALNRGLELFAQQISADQMALKRVETALVSFGPVQVEQPFATMDRFTMPHLSCGGGTPMGEAVDKALQLIKDRQAEYKANGVPSYTPWVWLITDGEPTDSWQTAAASLKALDTKGKVMAFAVGVDGADTNCLANFSARSPVRLKEARFEDLFGFVSKLMSSVAASRPGDRIAMGNPEAEGWGEFAA